MMISSFVSGGLAGSLSLALTYPLIFMHTRLAADVGTSEMSREFHGIYDCINKIYKTEGMVGFYRGITVSLAGVFFYRAMYFGLYDMLRKFYFSNP